MRTLGSNKVSSNKKKILYSKPSSKQDNDDSKREQAEIKTKKSRFSIKDTLPCGSYCTQIKKTVRVFAMLWIDPGREELLHKLRNYYSLENSLQFLPIHFEIYIFSAVLCSSKVGRENWFGENQTALTQLCQWQRRRWGKTLMDMGSQGTFVAICWSSEPYETPTRKDWCFFKRSPKDV